MGILPGAPETAAARSTAQPLAAGRRQSRRQGQERTMGGPRARPGHAHPPSTPSFTSSGAAGSWLSNILNRQNLFWTGDWPRTVKKT